jgi:hypothetical protein
MNEWMPVNPFSKTRRSLYLGVGMITNYEHTAWGRGSKTTAKKLLEYLIKRSKAYSMPDTYSAGIPVDELQSMLKTLISLTGEQKK